MPATLKQYCVPGFTGVTDAFVDGDSFIVCVSKTKTSGSNAERLPLDMVGPADSITGQPLMRDLLEWRQEVGAPIAPYPILPSFSTCWQTSSMKLDQFNIGLKELLLRSGSARVAGKSSHSCKRTTLAWAAKWGMSAASREKLGYHRSRGESRAAMAYSRDRLAEPVEELVEIFAAISLGKFLPDASRGNRKPKRESHVPVGASADDEFEDLLVELPPPAPEVDEEVQSDDRLDNTSESDIDQLRNTNESEVSPSGDESDQSAKRLAARAAEHMNLNTAADSLWRNLNTRVVHKGRLGSQDKLHCGRVIEDRFSSIEQSGDKSEDEVPATLRCKRCFGRWQLVEGDGGWSEDSD